MKELKATASCRYSIRMKQALNASALNPMLKALYEAWRGNLQQQAWNDAPLTPPLLLDCTESYATAGRRILFVGQETRDWGWSADLRQRERGYSVDYPFDDIWTFSDFLNNIDAVEALTWGYKEFKFAASQPKVAKSPFWRAFREVGAWDGAGVMWSNVCRAAFGADDGKHSFFRLPRDVQSHFLVAQAPLFAAELDILKPDTCMFFTGPYYDGILTTIFPDCQFEAVVDGMTARVFAHLSHPRLPVKSFRTYHPAYLSRSGLFRPVLDSMKSLVLG